MLVKLAYLEAVIGKGKSYQSPFPDNIKCAYCGSNARIGLSVFERWKNKKFDKNEKFVTNLHKNEKDKYWPHDCVALANYFCEKCFKVTTLDNQA